MVGFEVVITHFNGSGKKISFKHALPMATRFFLKAASKEEAEEWLKNNSDTVIPSWICPSKCSGKDHKFALREIKIKEIPKDARVVNLH